MLAFAYILIFILGTAWGSFVNALVYRLKTNTPGLASGRSLCPNCKHQLAAYDLIPILSFFILGKRCRYCQHKISSQYPIVEFLGGCLFLLVIWQMGFETPLAYLYLIYVAILLAIAVYDYLYWEIPDEISLPAIFFAFLASILPFTPSLQNALLGALIPTVFFGLQFLLSKGKFIGGGDLRLGILMGLILGWKFVIVALCLAYLIGAIVALPLLVFKRQKGGTPLPFAPLLSLGTLLSLLWGNTILNYYLNFIL